MNARASVANAGVAYGRRTVFSDVDLTVAAGTFTAIVGRNGSGKSSLLRLLAGTQAPSTGSATRDGRAALIATSSPPPPDVSPSELADYGLALHRPWWRLKPSAGEAASVAGALARTGLVDRASDPVSTLSDGEIQRAWVAAALAAGCSILLVDEPTSHLDLRYQIEVLQTLRALSREGVAVAAAIHDLTLAARYADVAAMFVDGGIAVGSPRDVLTADAVTRAFGVGVTIHDHPTEGYLVCMPR